MNGPIGPADGCEARTTSRFDPEASRSWWRTARSLDISPDAPPSVLRLRGRTDSMLQANDLTKRYDNHTALDQLNLTIDRGEIFCLLGANGAGKTTTINLFLNFIPPTAGQAII